MGCFELGREYEVGFEVSKLLWTLDSPTVTKQGEDWIYISYINETIIEVIETIIERNKGQPIEFKVDSISKIFPK